MPKKQARNGFMIFTIDWKSKYGKHLTLKEATTEAGGIWASMTIQERAPYNERAKQEKMGLKSGGAPKLTCTGKAITEVERERKDAEDRERTIKLTINNIVQNSIKNCQLKTQPYYFVMVNYFTRSLNGFYVPAEISVVKYTLLKGVCRIYHTFINPGSQMYGLQYEAQHHSENTHNLPLPPNAKGERDLGLVYNNILDFIRDPETGEYPPVYTYHSYIPVVKSVLEFLKYDLSATDACVFDIYSIQYLLYILKDSVMRLNKPNEKISIQITDVGFETDCFQYSPGIACAYHEKIDKSIYCSQSYVTRWGYIFSDSLLAEVAVDVILGRHVPIKTNLEAIVNPAPSTHADTESQISINSESTFATKAVSERTIYYDYQKAYRPARANYTDRSSLPYDGDDFPTLGAGSSRKKPGFIDSCAPAKKTSRMHTAQQMIMDGGSPDSTIDINPWTLRSRNVPRKPDSSHFDINYTRDETTDSESSTPVGYGRGRKRNNVSSTSNVTAGSGRGKLFQRLYK